MNTNGTMHKRAMVVDDSRIDRYIAEMMMKKTGVAEEVLTCESGEEALSYLSSHAREPELLPEIILLDILMPDLDGFQFLDKFKDLPEPVKEHCAISMISSTLDYREIERAKKHKLVKDFISKPLSEEVLKTL